MSEYRQAPQPFPLVMSLGSYLVAVEPETGEMRWKQAFTDTVSLMFRVDRL